VGETLKLPTKPGGLTSEVSENLAIRFSREPASSGANFTSISSSIHGTMSCSHLGLGVGLTSSHSTQPGHPSVDHCSVSGITSSPTSRQNHLDFPQPLAAALTSGPNDVSMNEVYMSDDDNSMEIPAATNPDSLPDLHCMCLSCSVITYY